MLQDFLESHLTKHVRLPLIAKLTFCTVKPGFKVTPIKGADLDYGRSVLKSLICL